MKLAGSDILRLLPEHISGDPQFAAAGKAANPVIASISKAIPNLLLWARLGGQEPATFLPPLRRLTEARPGLDPLDMATLESLAWQFHVDFREVAETRAQLAEMVLHSIAWHRIKGTPASIREALSLFGFGGIHIDEHDTGMHWATYQLGFDEVASLDDLALIIRICNEMQPARCRLWRVYTSDYDFRPGVWSGGMPDNVWSGCWWSGYSGTYFPDLPGLDDRGLLVSFGLRRRFLCEKWADDFCLGAAFTETRPLCLPLSGYPVWSVARWSDYFPARRPFALVQLIPLHGCEKIFEPEIPWLDAPWQEKPWAAAAFWDRRKPKFSIFNIGIPFSQEVWSDSVCKGGSAGWRNEPWRDERWPKNASGGWSGENSFWGTREILVTAPAPAWGEARWSDAIAEPAFRRIDKFFYDYDAWRMPDCLPPDACIYAGRSRLRAFLAGGWPDAAWPDGPWPGSVRFYGLQTHAMRAQPYLKSAWPDEQWPDNAWADMPTSLYAASAVAAWSGFQTERLEPGNAPLAAEGLASMFAANSPKTPEWQDGPWPECAWGQVIGHKRRQEPFAVNIISEQAEETWAQ